MSLCGISGCTKQRDGYSPYCGSHKRRQRRHGSPVQTTISAAKLRPHREAIKRWLDSRPEQNGWEPLRTLFRHLVDEARAELERARTQATPRYLRQAHEDILKVADEGTEVVDQAILTVAAMYDLHHWEPGIFASDDGFRVQLARRFRAHSDLNVAVKFRSRRTEIWMRRGAALIAESTSHRHLRVRINCLCPFELDHSFVLREIGPMARKLCSDEDILNLLREIGVKLASGIDVPTACRSVGISDRTYYNWRKRFAVWAGRNCQGSTPMRKRTTA